MITYSDATYVFLDGYQPFGQDNGTPRGSFLSRATDRFVGERLSTPTGLYYNYQRWYDPTIGRFISLDPEHGTLSDPQTLNGYIYVIDQPTTLTDPSGEKDSDFHDRPCPSSGCGGPDPLFTAVSNWWNGLTPTQRVWIAVGAVVTIVAVSCLIGCEGLLAVPEIIGSTDIITGIGLGSLSTGAIGLGDLGLLGLGIGGLDLGIILVRDWAGSSSNSSGGGINGGGFFTDNPEAGNKRPPPRQPDHDYPKKLRPPRWGEPGKTIPSAPGKAPPSRVRAGVCAALGLGGLLTGFIARAETADTGLNYPLAGGVGGLVACLASLKRG